MAENTKIEWTDATWNPITGCSVASPGCTNCYAMELAGTRLKGHVSRLLLTKEVNGNHVWTGETRFNEQWLDQPLRWKKPRMIFVCAHGDLFHESVPDEWIDRVFAVMALAPQHTFQVLTKRSARMREYVTHLETEVHADTVKRMAKAWPHPIKGDMLVNGHNVWLGVSVEDQARADERVPDLLATPAAVRWLSCEPLLGPVDLTCIRFQNERGGQEDWDALDLHLGEGQGPDGAVLDWIVVGGESGRNARPMHPDWARSLRDQCAAAGVPYLFKQWGEWADWEQLGFNQWRNATPQRGSYRGPHVGTFHGGEAHFGGPWETRHDHSRIFARLGKKRAGRLLDGVEHNEFPEVASRV